MKETHQLGVVSVIPICGKHQWVSIGCKPEKMGKKNECKSVFGITELPMTLNLCFQFETLGNIVLFFLLIGMRTL